MRRCVILLGLAAVACGGPDRETFVRDANAACRERAAGHDAVGRLPLEEMLPAVTKLYAQELERLRALEPPPEDRARYDRWVRGVADGFAEWRRFARHAERDDYDAGEPARLRAQLHLTRAARIADQLGLTDCDTALS